MSSARLLHGDCRFMMAEHGPYDLIIADPPYGDTSLEWDKHCDGWIESARRMLKPCGSMWVWGSFKFFIKFGRDFENLGFKVAQDIVWEKHNGSSFHADRFKRVHEHAVQFYPKDAKWKDVYNDVQKTNDATAKTARRKKRPPQTGYINQGHYVSYDGGPRIMRSVVYMRSAHGRAIHPTEKPDEFMEILIRTSCPEGGLVGDMFAGSASAGVAAVRCGRDYVGCEIDGEMREKAMQRLMAGVECAA